jgi:CO/xanthine dehydrogenase FAD-binding subunit
MITAYHRPRSIDEALRLIVRASPVTLPLGGGSVLSHHRGEKIEVVDLQALGLNRISRSGNTLTIGAAVTLQQLLESPEIPKAMAPALKLEVPLNLRNSATVGGTLMVCDGRSGFVAMLLALDTKVTIYRPSVETLGLGELLPMRPHLRRGCLITAIEVPLAAKTEFDYVSRTPADSPIVAVALAQWPSGRIRLAVGGHGKMPLLAMDGTGAEGLEAAARNALHGADDPWGSAGYRMDVAATLARRCLARLPA